MRGIEALRETTIQAAESDEGAKVSR